MSGPSSQEQARPRRAGRQLDPSRAAAIMGAALEGLAEVGYDRLSMDEIAARAHAGKGALYRRWPSKAALVVDAVAAWRERFAPLSFPDTGSLRGDCEAAIAGLPDFDDTVRRQIAVFVGLATAASHDPELRAGLFTTGLERPRRAVQAVLARAVERGEIPAGRDLTLVPDILMGLNTFRALQGEAPDRDFLRRVLDTVIYPLVTAPVTERQDDAQLD
jgi:AcrR family transcriptional regulator